MWYSSDVYSYNINNTNKITSDGGAYRGFISIRDMGNSADGSYLGLYIDPSGYTGVLKGDFTGTVSYGNSDNCCATLAMSGGVYPVQIGTSAVSPLDFYNNIASVSVGRLNNGTGIFNGSGSISVSAGNAQSMNISGQYDWGVSQLNFQGTYSGTSGNSWSLASTGSSGIYTYAEVTGSLWSDNKISGSLAGYWADFRSGSPATGIEIGELKGTFSPLNYTWQATSMDVWLETNKFLNMASTSSGQAKLQQLNIPAIEVGRTNLAGYLVAGASGASDFVSVFMNNVIFFAPTNGQKPSIWATNGITGQYSFSNGLLTGSNITNPNNAITLSNNSGINANFQFNQWNATNNTWLSTISNGTGTLSGGSYTGAINFNGAAAGAINTSAGTFTGTGAGISK